jgi:PIN domain nuclease of toxin-antitoxin system
MKYLLDTHAFLWYFEDSDKLSKTAANIIEDAVAQKYVSIASLWEFAVKYSMGKLRFDGGLAHLWEIITQNRFVILPIAQPYLAGIIHLPFHHRDPFDRLLAATAKAEGMTLVSADGNMDLYDVKRAW